jgi:gas vesicle protein
MKASLMILFMIIAVGFVPALLFAQQSSQEQSTAGMYAMQDKSAKTDMPCGAKGKMMSKEMQARHKEFQEKLKAMDERLDQKIAAMNSATGDQKMAAMSDVINEMASQRKEFEDMFGSMHGHRMAHGRRALSDTGPMMHGSGDMNKDMGTYHEDMSGSGMK